MHSKRPRTLHRDLPVSDSDGRASRNRHVNLLARCEIELVIHRNDLELLLGGEGHGVGLCLHKYRALRGDGFE